MALLLIRHGETDLNASRVVQFPDTPLGSTGLDQAERLGRRLAAHSVDLILTSDYRRARMTADSVAQHTGARLVENEHLRERNFGEIRGRAYEEFEGTDIFALDYVPPGGESWTQFNSRVDRAWQDVASHAQQLRGDVVVVTHGLVLRSLFERVLDLSQHVVETEVVVANTSVTIVDQRPPWAVAALACIEHLELGANDVAPV